MKNRKNYYEKGDDVSVFSLSTHETLIINPQISRSTMTDSEGEHKGPDEIILVFTAADPCPKEEREDWDTDSNVPLVVLLESKSQVDHLISTLQKLRFQLYGMDLSFDKIKN